MSTSPESEPQMRGSESAPQMRGPIVVFGVFGTIAALMMGAVVAPTLAARNRPAELEDYGAMPSFRLKDQTGGDITDGDLRGKVVVANFIFTRCVTVCPTFTLKMRRVQDRTRDVANDLKLISFSVDPAYDSPEVLRAYAEMHKANPGRWRFVTGAPAEVKRVVTDGLAIAMEEEGVQVNGAPNIVHSEHFVLFDRNGRIRGYYDASDSKRIERMLRDLRRLL